MPAPMDGPAQRRTKPGEPLGSTRHSTSPIERLNKEVKRRAGVVGLFPNEASIVRLTGAVPLEANGEWQTQHRPMQTEPMAKVMAPPGNTQPAQITTVAA